MLDARASASALPAASAWPASGAYGPKPAPRTVRSGRRGRRRRLERAHLRRVVQQERRRARRELRRVDREPRVHLDRPPTGTGGVWQATPPTAHAPGSGHRESPRARVRPERAVDELVQPAAAQHTLVPPAVGPPRGCTDEMANDGIGEEPAAHVWSAQWSGGAATVVGLRMVLRAERAQPLRQDHRHRTSYDSQNPSALGVSAEFWATRRGVVTLSPAVVNVG